MVSKRALAAAALIAGARAQFVQYSSSSFGLAVNIPSDTASSGSGSIFLQISAPSGTQWIGVGQGSGMSGSNMLVVYAADSSNVTVSPRLGTGHVEPGVRSDASVALLAGSGITSDGTLVANIRCDSCLTWSGGSMNPTSTSTRWIYAHKSGDPLDTTDTGASISEHDTTGSFTLDLTTGTGGSSANPFVAASGGSSSNSETTSAAASNAPPTGTATATATATDAAGPSSTDGARPSSTGGVSNPLTSSNPSSSGASASASDPNRNTRIAHAVVMSLVFLVMFPLAALTIYLPYSQKVRHIHGPLQVLSLILMIVGLGLGVELGKRVQQLDQYHQVIGYVVVAWMVLGQPALGLRQHLHFRRTGSRSAMGHAHTWLGRAFILLGVVNGGLGFKISGAVGSTYVPTYAVIVYSVVAAVIFLLYLAVLFVGGRASARNGNGMAGEKPRPRTEGYEMHGRSFDQQRLT